jgi:hypothetical protein
VIPGGVYPSHSFSSCSVSLCPSCLHLEGSCDGVLGACCPDSG